MAEVMDTLWNAEMIGAFVIGGGFGNLGAKGFKIPFSKHFTASKMPFQFGGLDKGNAAVNTIFREERARLLKAQLARGGSLKSSKTIRIVEEGRFFGGEGAYAATSRRIVTEVGEIVSKKGLRQGMIAAGEKFGTGQVVKSLAGRFIAGGMQLAMALELGNLAGEVVTGGINSLAQLGYERRRSHLGNAPISDTMQSYTMRQASLVALHNSQSSVRKIIGNEAGFMHR